MGKNQKLLGQKAEKRMMRLFKGKEIIYDEADFETKNYIFEVKSANLINGCCNQNELRAFKINPHKHIETHQLGRFWIKAENHRKLLELAQQRNKQAKYCFVIRIGNHYVFKTMSWKIVSMLDNRLRDPDYNKTVQLSIGRVF